MLKRMKMNKNTLKANSIQTLYADYFMLCKENADNSIEFCFVVLNINDCSSGNFKK